MEEDIFKCSHQISPKGENYQGIEQSARHFLFFMKIFGLFHENADKNVHTISTQDGSSSNIRKRITRGASFSLSRIYCFSVVILLFVNFSRCVAAYILNDRPDSNLRVFSIAAFGWYINSFLSATVLFLACFRKDRIHSLFVYYNKIKSDEFIRIPGNSRDRKSFNVSLALTVLVASLGLASLLLMLFLDLNSWTTYIFTDPLPVNPGTLTTVIVIIIYCKTSWLVPIMFVVTFCHVLRGELQNLNKAFQTVINTEKQNAVKKLNDFRIKHLQYEHVIALLDRDFRYIIASVFTTSMWSACFILYQLVNKTDLETVPKAIFIVWLLFNIFSILIISIAAALVSDKAHSFLELLHQLDVTNASVSDTGNMTLFIAKLSGSPIGFTAIGLLTVTKEFILTLVGLFFTYFFLLLQFKV